MNSVQLALRVLRVDRRTRTSAILTALGVAVATGLVLLLASLPYATQIREQRAEWQSAYNYDDHAKPVLLIGSTTDYFQGREITRVDVSPEGDTAGLKLPPGIPRLPGPGEVLVSPQLGRLLNTTPADQLGDRFGRPVAALGEQALRYPEQLVAFVGHNPGEGAGGTAKNSLRPVSAFPTRQAQPDGLLTMLSGVGIIVLLVPSLVLVASSARLTAARRERRLAALRLAGATPGQVLSMVAGETVLSAGVGAVLGLGISPALHGLATFVPWAGGTWLAADFSRPAGLTAFIVLAIPALVVLAGVLGLRRVLRNPLFATGGHAVKPLRWWRLLALPIAGAFFLYAVVTAGHSQDGTTMVLFGLLLLVGSAMVVGPWVTSAVGGTFVRIWRRPSSLLAGRRLRDDPKGAYRASAGIVLAVFTGSMALTLLPSFDSLAGGGRPFADSVLYADTGSQQAKTMVDRANATLARYGQPERALAVDTVYLTQGTGGDQTVERAFVMTCSDAARLTRLGVTAADCAAGTGLYAPYKMDASGLTVVGEVDGSEPGRPLGPVPMKAYDENKSTDGSYVLDPSSLPAGVTPRYTTVIAPTTDANREIVRTALASAAIGVDIGSRNLHLGGQQTQLDDLRRVTVIGLIAAGVLAGCSAAVATAGSVMDRRRTFGALIAAGTPVRVLSRALRVEAALPALVATIGAGVVGVLVGMGLFHTVKPNEVVFSPWLLAPVVLGIGVALLGASVCTPALKRVQAEPLADE
ncbi:ABC transporter permease [Amycolatopsis sp. PS_44_ISF1]|uniref:ABC transporter permease n=1 Tax=Amycolatopsis sp. PS_44_ISF1 TaxID=2974917 RepID=UPI0028DEC8FB|nr:ABC transporter permease [Amycolatopsis sp. PS_44_ISF1]MDT8910518.1 ABC transporter permease [Amycolatopsis sp. PS_44_ISF1]